VTHEHGDEAKRMPSWMRRPLNAPGRGAQVRDMLTELQLETVCAEAKCPNRGECYAAGTATFLVLGRQCTRDCRFCAVTSAPPDPPDTGEPRRVAEAARRMGLRHVVVTMVTRDDLADGGSGHVAAVVAALRALTPAPHVEVLVSDMGGDVASITVVTDSRPDVFNHNVETVPRLYPGVRPEADYRRSLDVLAQAAGTGLPVKSGLMVGLGEREDEVCEVLGDLRAAGVSLVTIGQYLRPSRAHLPVTEFVSPETFRVYALGFSAVASAPFVRSSYHAAAMAADAEDRPADPAPPSSRE
jgi:lipoic acid synthetase